jgi:hypothetical protein
MQFINGHTHTYGVQEPVLVVKFEHDIDRNELDIIGSIDSGSTEWIIGTLKESYDTISNYILQERRYVLSWRGHS